MKLGEIRMEIIRVTQICHHRSLKKWCLNSRKINIFFYLNEVGEQGIKLMDIL
jgi:hypothetical protein